MVNRKMVVLASILGISTAMAVGAQEPSPCQDGRHLIRGWEAEGLPGTKGKMTRTSIVCRSDGSLAQIVEVTKNGKTWKVLFQSTYRPASEPAMAAAEPAAAAVSPVAQATAPVPSEPMSSPPAQSETAQSKPAKAAPAPQSPVQPQPQAQRQQEGSSVRAVTRELQPEEIPQTQAPQLVMESPMVLEVTPGQISKYPRNSGWRSKETASFICDEVVIKQVGLGREAKGGSVDLIVEAELFTHRRIKRTMLAVEVIHDGQVVASGELSDVRLGLNIPSHGKKGLMTSMTLNVSQETFDAMFAGDNRPTLRYTLTVL
jgi:hypothetical protein